MPKYFETREGSLERAVLEAVSPKQQAAIAIAKKEKEQEESIDEAKFSDKQIKQAFGVINDPRWKSGNMTHIVNTIEKIAKGLSKHPSVIKAIQATNEELDKVNPKAVKKDFDDRKDKDIDNDGDVDDSDKFLHKRRKAISKSMAKEEVKEERSLAELAAEQITNMWKEAANSKKSLDKCEEKDDNKEVKGGKTMTGEPVSKVEINPKEKDKE
jgi:hypothetical protein